MHTWLGRAFAALGAVALAVDASNAMRHGLPVSERARLRCAPREEPLYVPHSWSASEFGKSMPSPR
ncbi:hypothetical protein [Streptomyces sp. SM12]|uniref:hypothetical protein n=1 Tax=Streptomyces sp. SM12 TaxID=1071602 RepID=UPI0011B00C05|nr:hypothetical protein [Streptomyces sp. SM12]